MSSKTEFRSTVSSASRAFRAVVIVVKAMAPAALVSFLSLLKKPPLEFELLRGGGAVPLGVPWSATPVEERAISELECDARAGGKAVSGV